MKRTLILGLAFAASCFTGAARADVDIRIGAGGPPVVFATGAEVQFASDRRHRTYRTPVRPRHFSPPVYYYPETVYGRSHRRDHDRQLRPLRPPRDHHLWQGQRPLRPPLPQAWSHRGQWGR